MIAALTANFYGIPYWMALVLANVVGAVLGQFSVRWLR